MEDLCLVHGDRISDKRYEIISEVGKGNFSQVYIARDTQQNSSPLVALKVLKPDPELDDVTPFEERIPTGAIPALVEQEASDKLLVPSSLFDVPSPMCTYKVLVMTALAGPNAFEYARAHENGRMPLEVALVTIKDAVSALTYLHRHNIGHGDFHNRNLLLLPSKPMSQWSTDQWAPYATSRYFDVPQRDLTAAHLSAMMSFFAEHDITFDGSILLADFGSAYESEGPEWLTTEARWVTMAPERLVESAWSLPSDVWSLACTIVEVLTGKELFRPCEESFAASNSFGGMEVLERIREMLVLHNEQATLLRTHLQSLWPEGMSGYMRTQLGILLEAMLVLEPSRRLKMHEVADAWRKIELCLCDNDRCLQQRVPLLLE